jgi:hypothetical protein
VLTAVVSLLLSPVAAVAGTAAAERRIEALDRMMVELAPESARASKTIREAYRPHLDLLVLNKFSELERALWNGGIAPLPADPERFNFAPRRDGPSPIGEKDLRNQDSYIAARPATIGALIDIASRVNSGPLEITSLVRHTEYQGALKATNANANTSVPMHTMGLAIDIALVNTPLKTVYEIRDVLLRMQQAGDILFIGERKQLVFHVVPHPSRLGHFTALYTQAMSAPPASVERRLVSAWRHGAADPTTLAPKVTAEVSAVAPTREFAAEWWAADQSKGDVTIEVSPALGAGAALLANPSTAPEAGPLNPVGPSHLWLPVAVMLAALTSTLGRARAHFGTAAPVRIAQN